MGTPSSAQHLEEPGYLYYFDLMAQSKGFIDSPMVDFEEVATHLAQLSK